MIKALVVNSFIRQKNYNTFFNHKNLYKFSNLNKMNIDFFFDITKIFLKI